MKKKIKTSGVGHPNPGVQHLKSVRLSKNIIPIKYDIELRPDLENFTFEGVETIYLDILEQTKYITLHSKDLKIETVSISINKTRSTSLRASKIFAHKISYDIKSETATFVFKELIPKGKIKITIVFKGILNDKMRGFYKSSYQVGDIVHNMATTQFEATDARRAFPCFDEPAQKAIFNVSLVVPHGKTAISNTLPISTREHNPGYQVIKFAGTPKMSTYLLAFIIGDFEYLEQKYTPTPSVFGHSPSGRGRSIRVRVYTTPGKKHQAKFALDVTVKVLEFYEKYFDIPYPLDTLDMIAIPDFTSLAMENWGAITFREIGLLVDESNTSIGSKEMIAEVIAHELAHQWFGNLVTMEWWTHLWLNEGFASYIPYLVIDKLFPKWNIWERFATDTHGIALKLDALYHTHPIEVEVHHPNEIGEIFDEVSYSKGASVIRMLVDYLGEVHFRDGLRYYLKKHSYRNTETIHLWQAFEKVSKKKVSDIMKNWTGKSGYPVIIVYIKPARGKASGNLILSQERFFASPVSKVKAQKLNQNRTLWQIPVSINKHNFLMSEKTRTLELGGLASKWIKINKNESGFYRTAYSKELLAMLYEPVLNKELPPVDRLGIIRDLFALSEAGVIPTTNALEFLSAYKNEDNYTVWLEIAGGLAKLEQILAKTKTLEKLHLLTIDLFSPTFDRLGWEKSEGEIHTDTLLRSLVLSRLGRSGYKKVIDKAKYLFKEMLKGIHLDPDIRSVIYNIVATIGSEKEYKTLTERYKKESLHEEKNRIGNTLGDFKDEKILCLVSEFALSGDVRIQDTVSIISSIGMNPIGRNLWLKCIKYKWPIFMTRYGDGGHTLSRLVKAISASAEKKHLQAFTEFFKTHDAPGATRSIEQVKERLESNIAWLERDGKNIEKFLNQI